MEKSITLKPSELNSKLFEALRKLFTSMNASEVTISVKTPNSARSLRNETQEETNKRIELAAKYFEDGKEGISFSFEEFNELSSALPKFK